jgi:hypothetical protein
MSTGRYECFDPLFPEPLARRMIELCERFGSYGMYGQAAIRDGLGRGLAQRHDAALNFVRTGGRFGRRETPETLAARTNYFRETYAYGSQVMLPGIEAFRDHEGFVEGARSLYGRRVIEPSIVYANLLAPGQELAVHTDVPEFRGMNRTRDPEWLLVVMHHSGLFDRWRMPIATAVAYFDSCEGGEFAFYPDGRDGPPRTLPARHNTAVLLDTDSTFHGVDRVGRPGTPIPPLRPGMRLSFEGDGTWRVGFGDDALARYRWGELRFSISWKAYAYEDEAEQRAVREHADDLRREVVVARLVEGLRERGRLGGEPPDDTDLALLLIDEYIQFPPPVPPAAHAEAG